VGPPAKHAPRRSRSHAPDPTRQASAFPHPNSYLFFQECSPWARYATRKFRLSGCAPHGPDTSCPHSTSGDARPAHGLVFVRRRFRACLNRGEALDRCAVRREPAGGIGRCPLTRTLGSDLLDASPSRRLAPGEMNVEDLDGRGLRWSPHPGFSIQFAGATVERETSNPGSLSPPGRSRRDFRPLPS